MASQVSALLMVSRMESAVLPGRSSSASAPNSSTEAAGWLRASSTVPVPYPLDQAHTPLMSPPSSAAACMPAASAAADFSTHQAISPVLATAPTRSAARRIASARVLAADRHAPPEGGGDAGDVFEVEHLDGAKPGAVPSGGGVDVRAGFGDQRGAGMVDDPVAQHPGLPGPGQRQDGGRAHRRTDIGPRTGPRDNRETL
jgi:hypothetical protein